MLKRFGLAGMLFATLAVAPFTINAQDWNNHHRSATSAVVQYNAGNRRDQGRIVQSDREDRGRNVQSGDRDNRGRDTRNYDSDHDFRSYGQQREWNR